VPATRLIITEGNYLLLDESPWRELSQVLDACWWLDTPMEVARERLLARHIRGGRSRENAQQHLARSDEPNMRRVLERRRKPDHIMASNRFTAATPGLPEDE
jgi:pantothenate kinase